MTAPGGCCAVDRAPFLPPTTASANYPQGGARRGKGRNMWGHGSALACGQTGLDQALEHSHMPLLTLPDAPRGPEFRQPILQEENEAHWCFTFV